MTTEQAIDTLTAAGLGYTQFEFELPSGDAKIGTVVGQAPSPGFFTEASGDVRFTVAVPASTTTTQTRPHCEHEPAVGATSGVDREHVIEPSRSASADSRGLGSECAEVRGPAES